MLECENVALNRKSAQLASKMDKYKIDVMGISECRWMGQGKVKLNTGECNFFRERRQHTQTRSGNNDDKESRTIIAEIEIYW